MEYTHVLIVNPLTYSGLSTAYLVRGPVWEGSELRVQGRPLATPSGPCSTGWKPCPLIFDSTDYDLRLVSLA